MKKRRASPGIHPEIVYSPSKGSLIRGLPAKFSVVLITAVLYTDYQQTRAQEPPPALAADAGPSRSTPEDDLLEPQIPPLPEDTPSTQPMSAQDESALLPPPGVVESAGQRPVLDRNAPVLKQSPPTQLVPSAAPALLEGLQPSPVAERERLQASESNESQDLLPFLPSERPFPERPTLIQDAPGLQPSPLAQESVARRASLFRDVENGHKSPGTGPSVGAPKTSLLDYGRPNFRLGLAGVSFLAGLEFEFNDNVNVADKHQPGDEKPKSDLFIRPRLGIEAFIPISQLNVLSLRLDAAYEFSLNNSRGPDASPFSISPDSELSFDVFIGDVRINLHDRFGIETNAGSRSTVSNANNYTLFTNTAGIYAIWDINDLKISGGYDYTISRFSGSSAGERNRDSHILFGSASLQMFSIWTVGLEGSFIHSTSGESFPTQQNSFALGPFVRLPITLHTVIQAAAGVQLFDTTSQRVRRGESQNNEPSDPFADLETQNGTDHSFDTLLYWNLSISNRPVSWYVHTLSTGHERQLGIGADFVDIDFVHYNATWLLAPRLVLEITTGVEFLKQQEFNFQERSTSWMIGIGTEYKITPHLRAGVRYGFTVRSSDQPFRDYTQNRIVVSLSYDF